MKIAKIYIMLKRAMEEKKSWPREVSAEFIKEDIHEITLVSDKSIWIRTLAFQKVFTLAELNKRETEEAMTCIENIIMGAI